MTGLPRRSVFGAALVGATALAGCGRTPSRNVAETPGQEESAKDRDDSKEAMAPQRYAYGPDPSQFADLYMPVGRRRAGVVVIIHGGFWRSRYTLELGVPLAEDLSARGFACWNLEYRRVGNGGGWPQTFQDVAAGLDLLASAAEEHNLDTSTTTALGHSAGGHLAVWAAGRSGLPSDAPGGGVPAVPLTGVVSQSGVLNLRLAREERLGAGAVQDFLGSTGGEQYRLADPMNALPLPVPVLALHGEDDTTVPLSQSRSYVEAARAAGADAELELIPGDHYAMIAPQTEAWARVAAAVERLAGPH